MTVVILILVVLALAFGAWVLWPKIAPLVSDSETIFIARLQVLLGAVFSIVVLLTPDQMKTLLEAVGLGPWAPPVLIVLGIVTEAGRRNRATDV